MDILQLIKRACCYIEKKELLARYYFIILFAIVYSFYCITRILTRLQLFAELASLVFVLSTC